MSTIGVRSQEFEGNQAADGGGVSRVNGHGGGCCGELRVGEVEFGEFVD